MNDILLSYAGHTAALNYAVATLKQRGYPFSDNSDSNVTHLLLPVPSLEADGIIKGNGSLQALLKNFSQNTIIIGGNLDRPELQLYKTIDLLQDPQYIAQNANITAYCAIKLAMNQLPIMLAGCPVLVIGWGRIGKCLARLLRQLDADVTVASRKSETRAILSTLGYKTLDTSNITTEQYRLVFNTVPVMLCPQCTGSGLKIDLASKPGLGGSDIIWARGLPSKEAPESSGQLIADTVIRLISGKEC